MKEFFHADGQEFDPLLRFLDTLPLPMVVGQVTNAETRGVRPWRAVFVNRRFSQVIGYTLDDIGDGDRWNERAYPDPDYRAERLREIGAQADAAHNSPGQDFVASVVKIRCKSGEDRWFEISKNYGSIHGGGYFVTTFTDVTALQEARTRIEHLARTDDLTGLPNRRAMQDELAAAQARSQRHGRVFTCVIADIDHFKAVNDAHGHDCGDHVLVKVARVLERTRRGADIAARWGGEEFCLLLADSDAGQARPLIERLREQVASLDLHWDDQPIRLTMTFGVATVRPGEAVDSALARADAALYEGKRSGRDRVVIAP